jgi:hypothetical protein
VKEMAKVCINVTIEPELLHQIDLIRREQSLEKQKDISRSSYMCDLLKKALTKTS